MIVCVPLFCVPIATVDKPHDIPLYFFGQIAFKIGKYTQPTLSNRNGVGHTKSPQNIPHPVISCGHHNINNVEPITHAPLIVPLKPIHQYVCVSKGKRQHSAKLALLHRVFHPFPLGVLEHGVEKRFASQQEHYVKNWIYILFTRAVVIRQSFSFGIGNGQ